MGGNNKAGLVVQERDRKLLRELALMRVIDREVAQRVAGFRSITRANTRLLALTRAGLLHRFFMGTFSGGKKSLYSLSPKGAQLIGLAGNALKRKQDSVLVGDRLVEHQSRINQVHLAVKFPSVPWPETTFRRWQSFTRPLSNTARIIPDGYFETEHGTKTLGMFLEVDLGSESHKVWQQKIEGYLRYALSGDFPSQFGLPQFRVLVLTTTSRRAGSLRKLAARHTDKIFWFADFAALEREGMWACIWFRTAGEHAQTLYGGAR